MSNFKLSTVFPLLHENALNLCVFILSAYFDYFGMRFNHSNRPRHVHKYSNILQQLLYENVNSVMYTQFQVI